ncbi:MAG: hypothetical protein Q9164_001058 [Protoblastenia rupestris]
MAATTTTTQYQLTQIGGPFALVSVPRVTPGPNEVCIRMKAIGLNPLDWKPLYFGAMIESWPGRYEIQGWRSGVKSVRARSKGHSVPGDSYCAGASCGEETGESIYSALKIPLLYLADGSATGSQPQSILVPGGSSDVGASASEILRLVLPSTTILTTSSPQNHDHLTSFGATKAFDQNSSSLITDIKAATPEGRGVDIIVAAVAGGAAQPDVFCALSEDGPREYAEAITGAQIQTQGGVNVMPALADLIEQGKFRVPLQVKVAGSGLEAIATGLEEL